MYFADIDTIEIRSDEDPETSSITARRSYNYKVRLKASVCKLLFV